jgi:hypothetical protein
LQHDKHASGAVRLLLPLQLPVNLHQAWEDVQPCSARIEVKALPTRAKQGSSREQPF